MTKAVKKKKTPVINFNTNKSDKKIQIKALKTTFSPCFYFFGGGGCNVQCGNVLF